jgi:taurine dioxygenase
MTAFTVTPVTPNIGAEIGDIHLTSTLSEATMEELEQALLQWKVLFFRDQDIDIEDQKRLGSWFGELEVHHPTIPKDSKNPEIVRIEEDEKVSVHNNLWHSDVCFKIKPPLGSILRAREMPAVGGDTLFANMEAAYAGLSDDIKTIIDGAHAVHGWPPAWIDLAMRKEGVTDREAFRRQNPDPEHPIVRRHPQTGNKCLYVNIAFTRYIVGMDQAESDKLLRLLYRQAAIPEYQCRLRWQKNTVAFWDNRCTQHYAVADFFPQRRVVERITICGDRPV